MSERVERELVVEASPEEVWETITSSGWLADDVRFELRPGGDAVFRSGERERVGWVEDVCAPERLTFWWALDGEPATRVQLTVSDDAEGTVVRVVESRPLDVLDLVGTPLPRVGGETFGPALVAA